MIPTSDDPLALTYDTLRKHEPKRYSAPCPVCCGDLIHESREGGTWRRCTLCRNVQVTMLLPLTPQEQLEDMLEGIPPEVIRERALKLLQTYAEQAEEASIGDEEGR